MPLFEFQCRACSHTFETLVRGSQTPSGPSQSPSGPSQGPSGPAWSLLCPACHSQDIERLLSSFGVGSESRSHSNLQAARRDFTDSTARKDQIRHEAEVVRDHVQEDYGIRVPKPGD